MKIYLDNCCFNRPYDDQSQTRILQETEAKLLIQQDVRLGKIHLVWSYVLDYENAKNPNDERKKLIQKWDHYATINIIESPEIISIATHLYQLGFRKFDSLHIASAQVALCDYFITTDDQILKQVHKVMNQSMQIVNPNSFIKEAL